MGRFDHPQRRADPAPGMTPAGWDPAAPEAGRKPRVARRVFAWLLALLALGGAGYWFYTRLPERAGQEAAGGRRRGGGDPVPVLVAKAERRDVPVFLDGLGTVQASNTVSVKPQVDGTLIEVRFTEGQDVRAGDVLARIDPRPYQATLDQAAAKKQQDEAALANARLDAARFAKLAANAFTSAQQADTARAQVAQMEAQVRADQAAIDQARTQLGFTTIASPIDGRTGIRQVDAGNLVRSGDATPLTVITQLKPVSVLFTLPQQALPAVAASMEGGARPEVQALRQAAGAQSPGAGPRSDDGAPPLLDRGELAVLDNQVDPQTGTIKLKATFPNEALRLWPGGFVNVRLLAQTLRGAVAVPTAAVQRGPRGAFLYVVDLDNPVPPEPGAPPRSVAGGAAGGADRAAGGGAVGRANAATADERKAPPGVFPAARRPVRVGHEDAGFSVVLDGVEPGETVVTDGAQRLTDGGKVAVAGPDGNAPEAAPPPRGDGRGRRRRGG